MYNYTLSVPNSVDTLTVNHTETANTTFKSVTGNTGIPVGIPTDVVITVANTKGIETKYTITLTRQGAGGDTSAMAAALKNAAAKLNCTNATTADSLKNDLKTAIGSGYNVAVAEFYKLAAVPGAKDGSGVIVPGANGYVSAVINLTNGSQLAELPLIVSIKAPMTEYTFTADEVSKPSDFQLEDNGKFLAAYTGSAKKIVIPDGVEEIGFGWNQSDDLGSGVVLVIPDSVKTLPTNLAYGMKHLETVYMGNGTTELPASAFDRCIFLQQVHLSENLKNIGPNAFAGTTSLLHIRLPESLETIGANAFYFSLIRDITVPAGVKTIGDSAFAAPYNATFQLVKGSDNMYFMFVFDTADDPDLARLTKISDDNVDYWDSKGNTYDTLAEAPIGFQWGGDKAWPNGSVYVTPRVVTILGKDTQVGQNVFYTQNGFCIGGVTVRLPSGSVAANTVKAEIAALEAAAVAKAQETGEAKAIVGEVAQGLDMTITEAAARAQFAVDHLILTGKSTADSVIAAVKSAYVSTAVKDSPSWKEAFKIAGTTATGVIGLKNDKLEYDIVLNAALSNIVQPIDTNPSNPVTSSYNPGFSDSLVPLSVISGSKVVLMDWNGGTMTVLKNTTIAEFLKNVKLEDGYTLEFYDDEGNEIYEEYYNTAILEDGFILRVKKGYSLINEFSFATADSLPNPGTGVSSTVIPALLAIMLAATGVIVLRPRKKKAAQ